MGRLLGRSPALGCCANPIRRINSVFDTRRTKVLLARFSPKRYVQHTSLALDRDDRPRLDDTLNASATVRAGSHLNPASRSVSRRRRHDTDEFPKMAQFHLRSSVLRARFC